MVLWRAPARGSLGPDLAGRVPAGRLGRRARWAGLLPADKTAAVRDLQLGGARVLAPGDGVNDAPALATADVGVARGARGAALSTAAADVVVLRDELAGVPAVLALARRAQRVVTANLVLAAAVVVVVLVGWDLLGTLPLPLGVAGHEASTVVVGLNGLRLLRSSAWPARTAPVPSAPARRSVGVTR